MAKSGPGVGEGPSSARAKSNQMLDIYSMSPLWPSSGLSVTTYCYRRTHIRLIATACSSVSCVCTYVP